MKNPFKLFFNMNGLGSNDKLSGNPISEDEKTSNEYLNNFQSINARNIKKAIIVQHYQENHIDSSLADQKIIEEVELIRKSRFFADFDVNSSSLILANKIVNGELSNGSASVRSRALAWCTRFLVPKEIGKAEEYIKHSKTLDKSPEIKIADAFICSHKGDKKTALSLLADIDSPSSRSAALMIVTNYEGPQAAINWLETTDKGMIDLNSEGKFSLLSLNLQLTHWDTSIEYVKLITDEDFLKTPILNHMVAITYLISTIPNELRAGVLNQLPMDMKNFPLAADQSSIKNRRLAYRYFTAAATVAHELNCHGTAEIDNDYALWLELLDPDKSNTGMKRLKDYLNNPKFSLHFVYFGVQFGIALDFGAIEQEINREIAINGGITRNTALARFALTFTKKPSDGASYIAKNLDEFAQYLDKRSIQCLQIEMFARAGQIDRAKECLNALKKDGLSKADENKLQTIITEAGGSTSIEYRKEQFEKTDSLEDLMNLVHELESKREWEDLCEYGEILFERTHSLPDAERLANVLTQTQKDERLTKFLKTNSSFLAQSKVLQLFYCWSLYCEGSLLEARSELFKLHNDQENHNYRALQINLGVTLGDWKSLPELVSYEYQHKNERNAQELIQIAQFGVL